MKALLCLVIVALLLPAGIAPAAAPLEVFIDFDNLPQGKIGIVRVSGDDIIRARAAFMDHQYLLVPDADGSFIGFIAAPMDAEFGLYRLSLLVTRRDGGQEHQVKTVKVTYAPFNRTALTLPGTLEPLLDPETLLDEFALLERYTNTLTAGGAWLNSGLKVPPNSGISAGFGSFRTFNGEVKQRHTGIDFPAPAGTPVQASASGRVVLSQTLPIRGEYILIDHGSGLFSGYAHLSARHVEAGDPVAYGEVIGEVGSTGRSLGSHLHWEVILGGVWVDPLALARLISRWTGS